MFGLSTFLSNRAEPYAWPARPSDPTPHWKPGSRHIPPLWLAVQKLQNLRRREPAIQPHPEDNSGKSNIQAPKQPAQNTNRTAGTGNIARAQHGRNQVLFRLFVEGEKANDDQITVAIVSIY